MKYILTLMLTCFFLQGLVVSQTIRIEYQQRLFMTDKQIEVLGEDASPKRVYDMIEQFRNTSWSYELVIDNDSTWLYRYVSLSPEVNQAEDRMYSTLLNFGAKDGYLFRTPSVDTLDYYAEIEELTIDEWVIDTLWEDEQLGYALKRAVLKSNPLVVADYTEQIPFSAGPGSWHGLPGMILHLRNEESGKEFSATAVEELPNSYKINMPAGEKLADKQLKTFMIKDRMLMRL